MSKKYWDVVPVTNWMQQSVAQLNYMTCGLVYQRKIEVVFIEEVDEFVENPIRKGHYTWKPF